MSLVFGPWTMYLDDDGVTPYYYNSVTQETTWTKPVDTTSSGPPTPTVQTPPKTPSRNSTTDLGTVVTPNTEEKVEKPIIQNKTPDKKSDMHNALKEMLAKRQSQTGSLIIQNKTVDTQKVTIPTTPTTQATTLPVSEQTQVQSLSQSIAKTLSEQQAKRKSMGTVLTTPTTVTTQPTTLPVSEQSQVQSLSQSITKTLSEQQAKRKSMGTVLTSPVSSLPPAPVKTVHGRPQSVHERYNPELTAPPKKEEPESSPVTPVTKPLTKEVTKEVEVPVSPLKPVVDEWQEFIDKKTGKPYYYNAKTKKTQWTKPEVVGTTGAPPPITPTHKKTESFSVAVAQIENTLFGISIPIPKVTSTIGKSDFVIINPKNTLAAYARDFFKSKSGSNSGFFKSKVSETLDPMQYQKSAPKSTYHPYTSEEEKLVLPYYDFIAQFTTTPNMDLLSKILTFGLGNINFRNELFVYAIKQISANPTPLSAVRGLRLVTSMITTFLPSKRELTEGLHMFVQECGKSSDSAMISVSQVCEKRLTMKMLCGVRKTLPSPDVLKEILQGTPPLPIFGVCLEEYCEWQKKVFPQVTNVYILDILIQHLFKVNAFTSEGIFRLTGEAASVDSIMDNFSLGRFNLETKDPHVVTSVLKNWLRELAEPLVPTEFYEECIASSDSMDKCVSIVSKFPQLNQSVVLQLVQFLAGILTDDFFKHTKMNIENISVVFAPNLLRNPNQSDQRLMMVNNAREAKFVRQLIESAQGNNQ